MPKKELPRPTDAELEILKVIWRRGPSTVREVFDALSALVMEGGPEGRKLALEHATRETNPRLKQLIEKLRQPQPEQ